MQRINDLKLQKLQDQLLKCGVDEFRGYRNRGLSSLIKECIEEYPMEMTFLLCEAICQEESITSNPFIRLNKDVFCFKWYDIAKIVFNHICINDEDVGNEKEYVSLIECIEKWIDLNKNYILSAKAASENSKYESIKFDNFLKCLFERIAVERNKILFHFCWSIYRGLPLYEQSATGKFSIVDDSNHDFVYLFMNGFYNTCPIEAKFYDDKLVSSRTTQGRFYNPIWVYKYYINNKQLAIFNDSYKSEYAFDDEQTIQLRRTAYRNAIGEKDIFVDAQNLSPLMTDENIFRGCHETKLMRIQKEVLKRFYGEQFDINDSDTWTKQKTVVEWLNREHGLSGREAKAIDMITRPDVARGK